MMYLHGMNLSKILPFMEKGTSSTKDFSSLGFKSKFALKISGLQLLDFVHLKTVIDFLPSMLTYYPEIDNAYLMCALDSN